MWKWELGTDLSSRQLLIFILTKAIFDESLISCLKTFLNHKIQFEMSYTVLTTKNIESRFETELLNIINHLHKIMKPRVKILCLQNIPSHHRFSNLIGETETSFNNVYEILNRNSLQFSIPFEEMVQIF